MKTPHSSISKYSLETLYIPYFLFHVRSAFKGVANLPFPFSELKNHIYQIFLMFKVIFKRYS